MVQKHIYRDEIVEPGTIFYGSIPVQKIMLGTTQYWPASYSFENLEFGIFTIEGQDIDLTQSSIFVNHTVFNISGQAAAFIEAQIIRADQGSFGITGRDINFRRSLVVPADYGEFTLDGFDTNFMLSKILFADRGSFAITGQQSAFVRALMLTAAPGAYAISGQDVNFARALKLAADQGAYSIGGQDADILKVFLLQASAGTYTISGQDVNFARSIIQTEHGSFEIIGFDATLSEQIKVICDSGTFTIAGQSASFLKNYVVVAAYGSYSIAGQMSEFIQGTAIVADTGTFEIIGEGGIPLTKMVAGNYIDVYYGYSDGTVIPAFGTIDGNIEGLITVALTSVPSAPVTYWALQGDQTAFLEGKSLYVNGVPYLMGAGGAELSYQGPPDDRTNAVWQDPTPPGPNFEEGVEYEVALEAGSGEWGTKFIIGGKVILDYGSYSITGYDIATLQKLSLVTAGQGVYTLTGYDALLKRARMLVAGQGSYSITGQSANFYRPVSSLSVVGGTTANSGTSIAIHASAVAGDIAVLFDVAGRTTGIPAAVQIPAGWTAISSSAWSLNGASSKTRTCASYKVLTAGDITAGSVNGLSDTRVVKIMRIYRPNRPVNTVTAKDWTGVNTEANPNVMSTTNANSETSPIIILGMIYDGDSATAPSYSTETPAMTTETTVTSAASGMRLGERIYNTSPANHTIDMNDQGTNAMALGYLLVT